MTLPAEVLGAAPGRGRVTGRRVLVIGAGTRPSPEPDPPVGNGRAISVLAAREGAAVACADRDAGAAEATAAQWDETFAVNATGTWRCGR